MNMIVLRYKKIRILHSLPKPMPPTPLACSKGS
jgi:hypothetical protein